MSRGTGRRGRGGGGDDEEEEHYVRYGTPLVDEEELNPRKGKFAIEQGQARRVAPWKQEVTDSEGRRRFHGAFTGGYSAGFYNTVGSKEGWTPSTFSSSRNQRAGKKEQKIYDFLDEDEKEELKSKELESSNEYDVLGSTAAELARRAANEEYQKRPSAIPGDVPDEIIVPLAPSIGAKLLLKMGWRQDLDGAADRVPLPTAMNKGGGLGLDALKDVDRGHQDEDYAGFVVEEDDDDDSFSVAPMRTTAEAGRSKDDSLPRFTPATHSSTDIQPLRFPPPTIPADFTSMHVSSAPLAIEQYVSRVEPLDVPPPDPETTKTISGVAAFVARSGQRLEEVLKQKHASNPQFAFLFERSSGHDFYQRKVWEEQRNLSKQGKAPLHSQPEKQKVDLVGAQRGRILGERPLPVAEPPVAKVEAPSLVPPEAFSELTAQMTSRFTAGVVETTQKPVQGNVGDSVPQLSIMAYDLHEGPRREETPWRPTALLCKRFDLPDPFLGKNPPPLKPKTGVEAFVMAATSLAIAAEPPRLPAPPPPSTSSVNDWANENVEEVAAVSESSIDLYKAIFSDDENEEENEDDKPSTVLSSGRRGNEVVKSRKSDALSANSKAANDFLESLGKELGLRI